VRLTLKALKAGLFGFFSAGTVFFLSQHFSFGFFFQPISAKRTVLYSPLIEKTIDQTKHNYKSIGEKL